MKLHPCLCQSVVINVVLVLPDERGCRDFKDLSHHGLILEDLLSVVVLIKTLGEYVTVLVNN